MSESVRNLSWEHVLGHDQVVEQFRRCVARNRLASSFLFVGPPGVGKRTFAHTLAAALLCETHAGKELEACGYCTSCQQVRAGSHADLDFIRKPDDKSFIPLELFVGDKEHRMREGLCHNISLKPMRGGRKIAIIDDADHMNLESANCLLKTLEEPPPRSVLILIGTTHSRQLPTIRSRCQIIRFHALSAATIEKVLLDNELVSDQEQARHLARLAEGSIQRALELADEDLESFRQQLCQFLSRSDGDHVAFAKTVIEFVDQAGKDAQSRRHRMRQIVRHAAQFYRALMRNYAGFDTPEDETLGPYIAQAQADELGDEERAANCVERCLQALDHIDGNANQASVLECWMDDLAQMMLPSRV